MLARCSKTGNIDVTKRSGRWTVAPIEQLTIDRRTIDRRAIDRRTDDRSAAEDDARAGRAARATLRAQVGRLERELSRILAGGFPHIAGPAPDGERIERRLPGPCLLTLGELERQRDELAEQVRVARIRSAERIELERRSRALLEEMRRAPHRHKFVRLPVADLGEGRCGFWQVRPRLGLVGMLAGWWEVKLSSGCP